MLRDRLRAKVLLPLAAAAGRIAGVVATIRGLAGAALIAVGSAALGGWPYGLLVFGAFLVCDALK